MNTASYELEVTVPLSELKYIKTGGRVELSSRDVEGTWKGVVKRINDQVDSGTQTVKVFIGVSGTQLREGMYLTGEVAAKAVEQAMLLPRDLLVDQEYVYTVHEDQLKLLQVEVVKMTEEEVIVKGIDNGTPLLKNKIPGAFDGMKVKTGAEGAEKQSNAEVSNAAAGGK